MPNFRRMERSSRPMCPERDIHQILMKSHGLPRKLKPLHPDNRAVGQVRWWVKNHRWGSWTWTCNSLMCSCSRSGKEAGFNRGGPVHTSCSCLLHSCCSRDDKSHLPQAGLVTILGAHENVLCSSVFLFFIFIYLFFLMFLFIFETERDRAWAGKGQRGRETQNQKQAPSSEPSAQSPMRGLKPQTWDRDLSWSRTPKPPSHSGAPYYLHF